MPNYPKYDGEIRPRGNTRAELGITHFTESNIAALNKNAGDFLEEIGIDVGSGQEWTIPMTPNSYIPRMFIVGRDRNNHDRIQTFQSLGIKPGSPEFWRQVQLGNVFVYPAGKKDPVQLQADVYEDGTTQFHYSKPITQQTMPKSPVKQASVFKRFMNFISGRRLYKAEVEAWKNREADEDSLMKSLSDMAEEREKRVVPKNGKKSPEQEEADIKLQEVAAKKKQAEKEEQLQKAKVRLEHHDYHTGIMTSIYRPDPELRKEYPLFKKNQKDWGLYTQEHFDSLKKYSKEEIDIDKIQVGNEQLKMDEFTAVTMFALWDDDISTQSSGVSKNDAAGAIDIHAVSSLQSAGISEKDAKRMVATTLRSMYTGDLFINNLRDGEGAYFKKTTNAGRAMSVKAFQDYQKGDKTALSKIIADGINKSAENTMMINGNVSEQDQAVFVMSEKLLDLMEKDPELKEQALQNGLDQEKLKVVEGMKVMNRLDKEAREAEYKLAKANAEGKELPENEKKQASKAILKYRLSVLQMNTDNTESLSSEEMILKQADLGNRMQNVSQEQIRQWSSDPNKRPQPKPGKIWSDTAGAAIFTLNAVYGKPPKSVMDLTDHNKEKQLDRLADQVVLQEGLTKKTTEQLHNELRTGSKTAFNLAKASEKVLSSANKNQPEAGNQNPSLSINSKIETTVKNAENKNISGNDSVKDRAKMFESGPKTGI